MKKRLSLNSCLSEMWQYDVMLIEKLHSGLYLRSDCREKYIKCVRRTIKLWITGEKLQAHMPLKTEVVNHSACSKQSELELSYKNNADLRLQIKQIKLELEDMGKMHDKTENDIHSIQKYNIEILNSYSWRLTAPLRSVCDKIIMLRTAWRNYNLQSSLIRIRYSIVGGMIYKFIFPEFVKRTINNIWNSKKKDNNSGHYLDGPIPDCDELFEVNKYFNVRFDTLNIERVQKLVFDPAIKIISFDVFDTLLIRPTLKPEDIFYLLANKINEKYGVDFVKLRCNVDSEMGNDFANIDDIYEFIANKYNIDSNLASLIKNEEILCERQLLTPRADIKKIYDCAVNSGKKIIVISDMYFPGSLLSDILIEKGFYNISEVYVSCDENARKSSGQLYDVVVRQENVSYSEILHIGDNFESDYLRAIEKKIIALYHPSIYEICFRGNDKIINLIDNAVHKDRMLSILLGFSISKIYNNSSSLDSLLSIKTISQFACLFGGPLLTGFCLNICNDIVIQRNYNNIYFASRDGFLPHKIYAIFSKHIECCQGVYFYAGRRAYYPYLFDSFWDYISELQPATNIQTYTLLNFIEAHFADTYLFVHITSSLSDYDKNLMFFKEKSKCFVILSRFKREIDKFIEQSKCSIKEYYDSIFDADERSIVFDLGYSGSIGAALKKITERTIDKMYFWESESNKHRDLQFGTKTTSYMNNTVEYASPYHLIFEELFSPVEGCAIGFKDKLPIFENTSFSDEHKSDIDCFQKACSEYGEEFCELFSEYLPYITVSDPDFLVKLCKLFFEKTPFVNLRLLKNIYYSDALCNTNTISLAAKMENFIIWEDIVKGTAFENPGNILSDDMVCVSCKKSIGIHLHLYHTDITQEVILYLQQFPFEFDLFVTLNESGFLKTAQRLFCCTLIKNLKHCEILIVDNRGRDIAPWVLSMRPFQNNYDLFCHIHTKKSVHFEFGEEWRSFLFHSNLFKASVNRIVSAFQNDRSLGCVFPSVFPKLRIFMTKNNIPFFGVENELSLMNDLLARLGFNSTSRCELLFSAGTMLWYRPVALRQLFDFDLKIDEFPEEPIGVGGSIAHAIERIPCIVASRNGFSSKHFNFL